MINKFIDGHVKPIQIHCRVCSIPLARIEWLRNGNNITNDQHFTMKTKSISIENEECLMTILTIHVG